MKGICQSVSTKLSAVFSAGSGTNVTLEEAEYVAGENISIWVYGENQSVVVRDNEISVGCVLNVRSVSNGSASSFPIASNATIRNAKEVVIVE